jgi:hypothetical protein
MTNRFCCCAGMPSLSKMRIFRAATVSSGLTITLKERFDSILTPTVYEVRPVDLLICGDEVGDDK